MPDDNTGNVTNGSLESGNASADYGIWLRPTGLASLAPLSAYTGTSVLEIPPEEFARDPELAALIAEMDAELLDRAALENLPDPVWLIPGILTRDSLSWLGAPRSSAKSFMALDWACCISTGRPWKDREIAGGAQPVIYLAAEGGKGIKKRVRAWEIANGQPARLFVYPKPFVAVARDRFTFGVSREWRAFVHICRARGAVLIVLDTQAHMTQGLNENAPYEMQFYASAVRELREATGACVLTVHHGKGKLRGATSIEGAAETIWMMEAQRRPGPKRPGDTKHIRLINDKEKDEDDGTELDFTLQPLDASCVLVAGAPDWASSTRVTAVIGEDGEPGLLIELPNIEVLRARFGTEWFSGTEAAELLNADTNNVWRHLRPLLRAGLLEDNGVSTRGRRYRVVSPSNSPSTEEIGE